MNEKFIAPLTYVSLQQRSSFGVALHFLVKPSFQDPFSYAIVSERHRKRDRDYFLVRSVGKQPRVKAGDAPPPSDDDYSFSVCDIDPPDAEPWIENWNQFSIPLRPKQPSGLDGESFVLSIVTGFHLLQLSWWCDGPEEWAPVVRHALAFMKFAERKEYESFDFDFKYAVDLVWAKGSPSSEELAAASEFDSRFGESDLDGTLMDLAGHRAYRLGVFSREEAKDRCRKVCNAGLKGRIVRSSGRRYSGGPIKE